MISKSNNPSDNKSKKRILTAEGWKRRNAASKISIKKKNPTEVKETEVLDKTA